jgi:two-component system OmpR family response regulator
MKILVVEDNPALAEALTRALEHEGFAVDCTMSGAVAIQRAPGFEPDIVVLDLGLPDMDGMEVLKTLRRKRKTLPILILTARDALNDKVRALDSGADDYLPKPFEMPELLARLRVLARRLGTATTSVITIGTVALDTASHELKIGASTLLLTRREYMVIKALMENAGRIQTKEMLESKLYGWGEQIASNTIEVHISNVRKKLPKGFIKTVRGVGYSINRDAAEPSSSDDESDD